MYLKYDLFTGVSRNKYRYILAGLILEGVCFFFIYHRLIENESLNLWDILWNLFSGTLPYVKSRNSEFKLPVLIIMVQSLLLIITGNYIQQELNGMGQIVILLSTSCKKWWAGKMLWLVEQVLLYYSLLLLLLSINILCLTNDLGKLEILNSYVYSTDEKNIALFLINLLVIPIATSIVLLMIQNVIGIYMGSMWGSVSFILSIIVASYKMHPFLIGNNFMMLRNSYFENTGIINCKLSYTVLLIIGCITYIIGYLLIEKKDFLNTEKIL